jgi:2-iminoacetate synthase
MLNGASAAHPLSRQQASALLGVHPCEDPRSFDLIIRASERLKQEIFHGRVFAIVPVYVSSVCQEHCIYCNYRAGNKDKEITRLRLSDNQLRSELELLVRKGYRVLELVYATDPFISVEDIARHTTIAKQVLARFGNGAVGLNARPYSVEQYRVLREAGLDFAVLWQETYDPASYAILHPGGTEKSDYQFRLQAPERMIEAGLAHIGLGVLSGLSDWRTDWVQLMGHVQYLQETFVGRLKTVILGLPRLKRAAGATLQTTEFIPDDREQLLAMATFNLFMPSALPFVNTRESWEQCLRIAAGGGTLFTLNCKTIPGGYSHENIGYQFPTFDFAVEQYRGGLEAHGLAPAFDWSFDHIAKGSLLAEQH